MCEHEARSATYFNGTATDIGLVKDGVLLPTGESLAQAQNRVLGTAPTGYLYTDAPGYIVFAIRSGWRVSSHADLTVIGENLTDRNYRSFGSGIDAAGINLQVRTRYRF